MSFSSRRRLILEGATPDPAHAAVAVVRDLSDAVEAGREPDELPSVAYAAASAFIAPDRVWAMQFKDQLAGRLNATIRHDVGIYVMNMCVRRAMEAVSS